MDPITRTQIEKILFKRICIPAMLEQAKADRADGKVLSPKMEAAVNIYSQILTDNPAPGGAR